MRVTPSPTRGHDAWGLLAPWVAQSVSSPRRAAAAGGLAAFTHPPRKGLLSQPHRLRTTFHLTWELFASPPGPRSQFPGQASLIFLAVVTMSIPQPFETHDDHESVTGQRHWQRGRSDWTGDQLDARRLFVTLCASSSEDNRAWNLGDFRLWTHRLSCYRSPAAQQASFLDLRLSCHISRGNSSRSSHGTAAKPEFTAYYFSNIFHSLVIFGFIFYLVQFKLSWKVLTANCL